MSGAQGAAARALVAEFVGTAALLAIVVGSGIMGERLAGGNVALALLANAAATAGGLYALIVLLGPLSGAHFNPVVTLILRFNGERAPAPVAAYVAVQTVAAIVGVAIAHLMFGEALWQPGDQVRTGGALWFSEGVATFGLLLTILLGVRHRPQAVPALVAAWIFAAYWFTASTSFANPAVTLARAFTQTFAGIRFADVGGFVLAQCVGALFAWRVARWLSPATPTQTPG